MAGITRALLCNGARGGYWSNSKLWIKLELSIAADGALVARPSQPISKLVPALSSAVTASTPLRETGSWAPTNAQAIPSSNRYLACSRTDDGTSSIFVPASQVASRPVGPLGSVGAAAFSFDT